MHRVVACLMLLGFFADASAATARDAESEKSSRKIASEPAAKSDNSTKRDERESERDPVNRNCKICEISCKLNLTSFRTCESVWPPSKR